MAKAQTATVEIPISPVVFGEFRVAIIGTTPLIMHKFSDKARRELLLPRGTLTQMEKETTLKHESPVVEAKACAETMRDRDAPTLFGMPAGAVKGGLASTALRLPKVKKTEIGQLVFIPTRGGNLIPLYGLPYLFTTMVRNSGQNRTPDVRSRIIFPVWAMEFDVRYIKPNLTEKKVLDLLHSSGMICGLGDWRPEKGKGEYGSFEIVATPEQHASLAEIKAAMSREAQQKTFDNLPYYDDDTADLAQWYEAEVAARGRDHDEPTPRRKGNGAATFKGGNA